MISPQNSGTWLVAIGTFATLSFACGGSPPPRQVVEHDLDDFAYRRYQKVLDVEFPIEGNTAVGHTATYVQRNDTDVVTATAFVTVYRKARSLTAEVRDRLRSLATYDVRVREVEGEYVWQLDGGTDRWILWVSGNRVVKIGSDLDRIPSSVAEEYLDLYPSDLDERGRAREGTESVGRSQTDVSEEASAPDMPESLREGAPR